MRIQAIERYSKALKVIVEPNMYYTEGKNYFYCDLDFEDLILSASSITFSGSNASFRYVYVDGVALHRIIMNTLDTKGAVVDHISGITWDNCRCNLRVTDNRGNALNHVSLGIRFDNGYFIIETAKGTFTRKFDLESDALVMKSFLSVADREINNGVGYNFLYDRRRDSDLVDLLRTDKITEEDELTTYISRYSGNAWFYYRYYADLKPYSNLFNLNIIYDEYGFICDIDGNILSPLGDKSHPLSIEYKDIEFEESKLLKRQNNLNKRKLALKRQEELLDTDIHECELDKTAFMRKQGIIDLNLIDTEYQSLSSEEFCKRIKNIAGLEDENVIQSFNLLGFEDEFNLFSD